MAASQEDIAAARELVAAYREAEISVLRNQSYEMPDGRKLTRANLRDIRDGKREAIADLNTLTGTTLGRARRGVARIGC
jgi:hypothetical protein